MNRQQQFRASFSEKSQDPNQSAGSAGGGLIIGGILAYFFFKYWQNNPDLAANNGRECWAAEGSSSASAASTGMGDVNVSAQFVQWFMFGFIMYIVNEVTALLGLIGGLAKSLAILKCAQLLSAPLCCGSLAFLIAGMVIRWRHVGQVCSGAYEGTPLDIAPLDPAMSVYMKDSGSFMNYYLIFMCVLCGIGVCCGACCVLCMCGIIGATAASK